MIDRPSSGTSKTRKSRDIAFLIPVFWIVLIMPPIVSLFSVEEEIAGIPLILLYLLAVWLGGIGVTAWNARRLMTQESLPPKGSRAQSISKPPNGEGSI